MPGPGGPSEPPSILLVDDNEENLLALEVVLKDFAAGLVKARSGREALKELLVRDFAVVLLDVRMPELDGFETARLVRQRDRSKDTPIIFMTAVYKGELQVHKGYSLGAVDYIVKPFDPDILRAKVGVFVELYRKREEVKSQEALLRRIQGEEHRRELAELQEQRNRFFYLSLNMLCILRFDGTLKEVNTAWETATGHPKRSLLSKPFIEFIHPDDREATLEHWRRLKAGLTEPLALENRFQCKDGANRWLLWSSIGVPREKLIYAAARDITDRKKMEQMKDEFLGVVSHELRTPITIVQTALGSLSDKLAGPLTRDQDRIVGLAHSNTGRLARIVNNILDLSRLESGRAKLELRRLDLKSLVEEVLGSTPVPSSPGAVKLETSIPDALPAVRADADMVSQVLHNLLDNALRYARSRVTLAARADVLESGDGRPGVRLSVADDGPGIAPEGLDGLFSKFHQVNRPAGGGGYKGTGLGLAICREIIGLHGGRIWIESEPGRGAAFHFILPAEGGGVP